MGATRNYKPLYVYLLTLNCVLGACFFGYVQSVMNSLQDYLQDSVYHDLSDALKNLFTSLVPAGAAVGAVTAGTMANRCGRKKALIITDLLSLVVIAITLIRNPYFMLVGRLFSGVVVGFNSSLVPLYVSEMSPVEMKGITGTFTQVFISIGILLAFVFGLFVPTTYDPSPGFWWRFMLGFPLVLAAMRTLMLLFIFRSETPIYLVLNGKDREAEQSLERIYHTESVPRQLDLLRLEKEKQHQTGKMTYRELFSSRYSTRLKLGCFLTALQQFSGVNAIIFYSTKIFKDDTDPDSNKPQVYTMIVGILNLMSALIVTFVIGRVGRRTLFLTGTSVLFISLILLPITGYTVSEKVGLAKYFIFLFILGFGFSIGSVTWIYVSEILPDLGVGVAVLVCWISCVIVAQSFPYLLDAIGANGSFLIFAVFCLIGVIVIFRWVKETKGKERHEIAQMFEEKNPMTKDYQRLAGDEI